MIAIDTNLLVRIVTNDDPAQSARATQLLAQQETFVPKTVLLELEWVLRDAYGLERAVILNTLRGILGSAAITVEDAVSTALAVEWYEAGLDFADALHLASSRGADRFVTFDDRLHRRSKKIDAVHVVLA